MTNKNLKSSIEEILKEIQGWCSKEKAIKFIELIEEIKPDLCVEIGVFGGSSFIPQALAIKNNKKGKIVGIDPWNKSDCLEEMIHEDHKKWWGELDIDKIYQDFINLLEKYKVENFIKILKNKSENVINEFEDNSIDILHIDGNHSEILSLKDSKLYLPKVKIGGYIVFDDIWWSEENNYVTTRKAIMHLMNNCEKVDIINNDCLLLRKISNHVI